MKQIKIKVRNHYESVQFNYRTILVPDEVNINDKEQLDNFLNDNELLLDKDNIYEANEFIVENKEGKEYVESDDSYELIIVKDINWLKERQIYLNNCIKDDLFFEMVKGINKIDYFAHFPSDTTDEELLEEYINIVENMFDRNNVDY